MLPLSGKTMRYVDAEAADFSLIALPGVRVELSTRDAIIGETLSDANGDWAYSVPENSLIGILYTLSGYQVATGAITIYATGSYSTGETVHIEQNTSGTGESDTLSVSFADAEDDTPIAGANVSFRFGGSIVRLDEYGNPVWVKYTTGIGYVYDTLSIMTSGITDASGKITFTGLSRRADGTLDIIFGANKYCGMSILGAKTWKVKYNTTPVTPYMIQPLPEYVATTYYGVFLYVTLDGATCPAQVFWLTKTGYARRVTADDGTDPTQSNVAFEDITENGTYHLNYEIGSSIYIPFRVRDRITGELIGNIDTLDGYLYPITVSSAERHINVEMTQFHSLLIPFMQDEAPTASTDGDDVPTGSIQAGVCYIVDGYTKVVYDSEEYLDGERFVGVTAVTGYTKTGTGKVRVYSPEILPSPVTVVIADEDGNSIMTTSAPPESDTVGLSVTVRVPDGTYGVSAPTGATIIGIEDVRS